MKQDGNLSPMRMTKLHRFPPVPTGSLYQFPNTGTGMEDTGSPFPVYVQGTGIGISYPFDRRSFIVFRREREPV
jgi:hypothetical protein